jgi:hypothetical protein
MFESFDDLPDLYDSFDKIREKYIFYTLRHSIFYFMSFYQGYTFAKRELGIPETKQEQDFHEFKDWLEKRLDVKTSKTWADLIFFVSFGEKRSMQFFFELLDEFRNRNNILEEDED